MIYFHENKDKVFFFFWWYIIKGIFLYNAIVIILCEWNVKLLPNLNQVDLLANE